MAWTFATFGAFWGTWAVAAIDVERRLRLSHGGLGLLLSASVAAGGVVAAATGGVTHRMGTTRSLAAALAVWGCCVLGVSLAPGTAVFSVLFVSAMVVAGTVDAAMNTVVGIGARGDPSTMVRFHALFNAGALTGAGVTGVLLATGSSWRLSWAAVAAASFLLAAVCRSAALPGSEPAPRLPLTQRAGTVGDSRPGRFGWGAVRALHLRTLAGVFLATALVEGGIDTWGVLYLRTHLAAGALLGAGAYVIGQSIAAGVRWSSARHVGRIGARAGIVVRATVAAAGLVVEATARAATLAG
ncbi:MAG TPA: MFS transporter, partial [Acidimicrobiales bacterium]|nr:MFS transporter [Acidimicrobiales bacterium]